MNLHKAGITMISRYHLILDPSRDRGISVAAARAGIFEIAGRGNEPPVVAAVVEREHHDAPFRDDRLTVGRHMGDAAERRAAGADDEFADAVREIDAAVGILRREPFVEMVV